MIDQTTAPQDTPDFESASYREQLDTWQLLDDVWTGTKAIYAGDDKYLQRGPLESTKSFRRRLRRSRFFNMYKEAVKGLTGMVTRQPLSLAKDTNPDVRKDAENIDGRGTALAVLFGDLVEDGLHHGHNAIFVDFPDVGDPKKITLDVEQNLGIRPYWLHIRADQIINCRPTTEGGRELLQQVTIREQHMVPDGRFGEKPETSYRVLTRSGAGPTATVGWELWIETMTGRKKTVVLSAAGAFSNITEIPLVPVYVGERCGWFESEPPLYNLAETNLDHFAVQADHRANLHTSGVATAIFKDRAKSTVQAGGPETGIDVGKDGDAWYLETSGASLEASRTEGQDLIIRGASQGLSMMAPDARRAETAEAKQIDQSQSDSKLARAARAVQDAIEQAMVFHAQMRRVQPGRVTVPLALESLTLDASEMTAYTQMVTANVLSRQTFWSLLSKAGRLPEDFDPTAEEQRLAAEAMPATPAVGAGDVLDEPDPKDGKLQAAA